MKNKLYGLKNLHAATNNQQQIPSFIQDFIQTTMDKNIPKSPQIIHSGEEVPNSEMAHHLKFSLAICGVSSIQKDLNKIEMPHRFI